MNAGSMKARPMRAGSISRRRFLAVTAAFAIAGPAAAATAPTTRWRGQALGATAEITLRGPKQEARRALRAAKATLRNMERRFSLYDPASDLVRLNRTGRLERPAAAFLDLLRLCDRVHGATGGLFDPTIQPLWQILAKQRGMPDEASLATALSRIGWSGVAFDQDGVQLARPDMALTFNGIAQGYATDRVTETLAVQGFAETLVNIGEFRAGEGQWHIGIEDPLLGLVATRQLSGRAIATSSPTALRFGSSEVGHILNPVQALARPHWSSVTVEATSAACADGFSTAFALLDRPGIASVLQAVPDLSRVLMVDGKGTTIDLS